MIGRFAVLVCLGAVASSTEPPTLAVRALRMLNVQTGQYLDRPLVLIEGDRIVEVRTGAGTVAPSGARVIDLPNATLLPGLIDAHVHLTLGAPDSSAERTLHAGFTTVQDLGALAYANLAVRDAIARGSRVGPRVVASGPWLGVSGGICDFSGIGVRGADAFRRRVHEDVTRGADVIKVCVTGWPADGFAYPDSIEPTTDELRAAIDEAHRLGKKVAVHAIGARGVRLAVTLGVEHIVHSGFVDDSTLALMRERKVALSPTLLSFSGGRTQPFGVALVERMQRVLASGIPIVFGTDAGVIPHGRNAREFAWLTRLGMSPLGAIQSATVNAATLLGWSDRIGAIATGRYADLIAVEGDPLSDIAVLERVVFVMKGGAVIRDDVNRN